MRAILLASALILGPILLKLNEAGTVYMPAARVAPALQSVRVDAAALTQTAPAPGPATGSARRLEEPCDEGQTEGASSQRLQRIERRLDEMAGILQ